MHASIRLLALFALLPPVAHAVCVATPPARPLHLVELYTSEGCSSCPPAEHWLSSLHASTTFVPLEFHVDYFDDQGWRDPFSDPRYTARQQRLAKRGTRDQVYTPQIVVDGRPWKTWPKGSPPAPADPAAGTLTLEVEAAGADLRVALHAPAAGSGEDRIYVALAEDGLSRQVTAGENRGRSLAHDAVVRDFAGPLPLPDARATLHAPAGFERTRGTVVAFVEDERSGEIIQVQRVRLDRCTP